MRAAPTTVSSGEEGETQNKLTDNLAVANWEAKQATTRARDVSGLSNRDPLLQLVKLQDSSNTGAIIIVGSYRVGSRVVDPIPTERLATSILYL